MKRRRWTEAEEALLERLVRAGVADAGLPEHLPGRTRAACKLRRERMNLESPTAPGRARKHDYRKIGELLDRGMRKRDVDRALGLPRDTTANIARRGMV